jgi:hypothetical protein
MCFEPQTTSIPIRPVGFEGYAVTVVCRCQGPLSASARPARAGLSSRLRCFLKEGDPLVQLRALVLLAVGWLLSPLCWWNDLVINLPLAWGFARVLQLWHPEWFSAGLVIGYWLSNVVGVVLMQCGALTVFQSEETEQNRKRDLLISLGTSTLYTVAIMVLVKTGLLPTPLPAA